MAGNDGNTGDGGSGFGGGVFVGGGTLTFNNSTVALNEVNDPPGPPVFEGGGVFQSGTGAVTADNSLFAGNTAPVGADFAGNVTASNSLFQTAPTGTYSGDREPDRRQSPAQYRGAATTTADRPRPSRSRAAARPSPPRPTRSA